MATHLCHPGFKKHNMKKTLPLLLFFLLSGTTLLHAQTRTSVANGDWFNPATWSPAGVPAFTDQFIIVNTQVTFSQNIVLGGSTDLVKINPGAALINTNGPDTVVIGCGVFRIEGYLSTGWLDGAADDSVLNIGTINVTQDLEQGGLFVNGSTGAICVAMQLVTGEDFVNNGSVGTTDWINGASVTGNGGRFCISGNFINTDNISGNIDICDSSPGGFGDVNMGTISGSVTSCAAGPCSNCPQPTGIEDLILTTFDVKLTPNPFNDRMAVAIDQVLPGEKFSAELFDLNGRLLRTEILQGTVQVLSRGELESGVYFLKLTSSEGRAVVRKIIAE